MIENNASGIEFIKIQIRFAMNTVLLVKFLLNFDKELHEMEEMMEKSNLEDKKGNSND